MDKVTYNTTPRVKGLAKVIAEFEGVKYGGSFRDGGEEELVNLVRAAIFERTGKRVELVKGEDSY